jgi:hypothetical protein
VRVQSLIEAYGMRRGAGLFLWPADAGASQAAS